MSNRLPVAPHTARLEKTNTDLPNIQCEQEILRYLGISDCGIRAETIHLLLYLGHVEERKEGGLSISEKTVVQEIMKMQEGILIGAGRMAFKGPKFEGMEPRYTYGASVFYNNYTLVPKYIKNDQGVFIRVGIIRDDEVIATYLDPSKVYTTLPE